MRISRYVVLLSGGMDSTAALLSVLGAVRDPVRSPSGDTSVAEEVLEWVLGGSPRVCFKERARVKSVCPKDSRGAS